VLDQGDEAILFQLLRLIMHYTHRPCFFISLCFAIGIFLSVLWCDFYWIGVGIVFVFISASFFWCRSKLGVGCLYFSFIALGYIYALGVQALPPDHVAHLNYYERREPVSVEGVIVSDVDVRQTLRGTKTSFELNVERLGWKHKSGKVLVNIFRREDLCYGQRVLVTGKLHKPFAGARSLGHFSYEEYLKRNGVYWILSVKKDAPLQVLAEGQGSLVRAFSLASRRRLTKILGEYLTDIEAGVVQSLVLGGRYHIPDRMRDLFVQTGTAHILAISGMNVGAMAFLIFFFLKAAGIRRVPQMVLNIILLIAYCYFTGSNPSVVRATIMAIVVLAGFLFEKEQEPLNSLGVAAFIILLIDPLSLFDIGFQLSFMGVFSIIYFYPRLYGIVSCWAQGHIRTFLIQALCISLAAWVGVMPLIGYYFQIVTPVTIVANIPIIPFVSALFMLGAGLIVLGLVCPPLAFIFSACIKVVFFGLMAIVYGCSQMPWGYFYIRDVSVTMIVLYYVVLGLAFVYLPCFKKDKTAGEHVHFLS